MESQVGKWKTQSYLAVILNVLTYWRNLSNETHLKPSVRKLLDAARWAELTAAIKNEVRDS